MLMVNAMVQHVTGPDGPEAVPNWAFMNLCYVSAQTDRQMGASRSSEEDCKVCKQSKLLSASTTA